jgi:hypothetical protein
MSLSALVAMVVAALTASLVGAIPPDQDRVVRLSRGGPQRLDSIDGILRSHEISEPDTTASSLLVAAAPASHGSAGRAARAVGVLPNRLVRDTGAVAPYVGSRPAPPHSARLAPHAPGRAPPQAS